MKVTIESTSKREIDEVLRLVNDTDGVRILSQSEEIKRRARGIGTPMEIHYTLVLDVEI